MQEKLMGMRLQQFAKTCSAACVSSRSAAVCWPSENAKCRRHVRTANERPRVHDGRWQDELPSAMFSLGILRLRPRRREQANATGSQRAPEMTMTLIALHCRRTAKRRTKASTKYEAQHTYYLRSCLTMVLRRQAQPRKRAPDVSARSRSERRRR